MTTGEVEQRTIKFRAWDTAGKVMITHSPHMNELYLRLDGKLVEIDREGAEEPALNYHLLQFTGLLDKNGKEIYEGDVIQFKHYYAHKRWWNSTSEIPAIEAEVQQQRENMLIERETVTFADGAFRLGYGLALKHVRQGEHLTRGRGASGDYEEKCWDFEVIGNVYETSNVKRD